MIQSCTAPKKRFGSDSHEAVSTSHSRTEREDRNPVSAPFQVHPEKTASRSCRSPKLHVAFGSKNNGLLLNVARTSTECVLGSALCFYIGPQKIRPDTTACRAKMPSPPFKPFTATFDLPDMLLVLAARSICHNAHFLYGPFDCPFGTQAQPKQCKKVPDAQPRHGMRPRRLPGLNLQQP